ncbi:MAG: DUF4923 family protein [Muribaculaceae bacterium]|nr:DUF4923 family protein [Muribaculaceae bacterium]
MKKVFMILVAVATLSVFNSSAFDLKGALQGLANNSSDSTQQSKSNGLGSLIGGIANLLGKTDVTIADLQGTWAYSKPAVAFKSDNLLKKAGGAAAAEVIEGKLAPYYEKAGIAAMKLTIAADSTFTMKIKAVALKGTLSKDKDGNFVFQFKALGKVNIGHATSVITKTGKNITVTFDASKLITIVSKIASVTGNSTIKSVSALLESYDGLNAGFELSKE